MRALATSARWSALTALCASLLVACGGGSGEGSTSPPAATLSNAEALLGVDLLPPDGTVSTAQTLSTSEMPPDSSGSDALIADELAPTS